MRRLAVALTLSPNNIFSGTGSSSQPVQVSLLRHFLFPQPVPAAPAAASTCRSLRFVFDSSDYIKHTQQTGSLPAGRQGLGFGEKKVSEELTDRVIERTPTQTLLKGIGGAAKARSFIYNRRLNKSFAVSP